MRRKVIVRNDLLMEEVTSIIESGGRVVLLAKGDSMRPFIVGGRDSVELSPVEGSICCGDILLAKIATPQPRYVIHRVILVEGDKLTLMGDGNLSGREECLRGDVVASVTMILKPECKVDPNGKRQRFFGYVWRHIVPVRRYALSLLRRLGFNK